VDRRRPDVRASVPLIPQQVPLAPAAARPPFWRDVRLLRWFFQIAIVLVVVAILGWLYSNYRRNVERTNIPTDFDFLDRPANFEIPGNPMSSTAPVRNALVEGLLNTMRVAVAGLVLATVLGTLIGIGRLSQNAVVRAICKVYVEVIRNLPLLVILLFANLGIVLQVLPRIERAWEPLGVAVLSNRGLAVPWFEGSGWGLVLALVVGLVAARAVVAWRRSVADRTGAAARSGLWALLVLLAILAGTWLLFGYHVTLPDVAGRVTAGGMRLDPSFFALLFALTIYTASHIAEIVRGSIQAVHRGQDEAAQALALSGFQRMWFVVLPQAFRIALPPIGNQYLNLIKNSSLGAAISYFELTNVTQISVANSSPPVPAFTLTLLVYLAISLVVSAAVNVWNRRMALVTR
jgi:general L-amino acid transport system permease protein